MVPRYLVWVNERTDERDTRLWRILNHYVDQARAQQDFSDVSKVGVDETSAKRGHDYITLFMDLEKSRLLFATDGKGKETVEAFASDLRLTKGTRKPLSTFAATFPPPLLPADHSIYLTPN